jgi:hypothetical protein
MSPKPETLGDASAKPSDCFPEKAKNEDSSPAKMKSLIAAAEVADTASGRDHAGGDVVDKPSEIITENQGKKPAAANATNTTTANKKKRRRSWEDSYQLLKSYKAKYGDPNVPRDFKDDPSLAEWCKTQRSKQKTLLPERKRKLEEIGFLFRDSLKERSNTQWEENFQRVKAASLQDKANPRTDQEGNNENNNKNEKDTKQSSSDLSRWMATQRQNYKRGLLSEERKKKLQSIGFEWSIRKEYCSSRGRPKAEDQWRQQYEYLVGYYCVLSMVLFFISFIIIHTTHCFIIT